MFTMFSKFRKKYAEDRIRLNAKLLVQALNDAGHKIHDPEEGCGLVCIFYHPQNEYRGAELYVQQAGKYEYKFPIDFEVL